MKYTIRAQQPLVEYWTYTVEADSLEEALQMVEDDEVENNDDYYQKAVGYVTYEALEEEEEEKKVPPCVGHELASQDEEEMNKRMDIIGQNGNEGTHYDDAHHEN